MLENEELKEIVRVRLEAENNLLRELAGLNNRSEKNTL